MGARIKLIKAYNNYIYDTFNASLIISVMLKRKYFGTFEWCVTILFFLINIFEKQC